ncbi:MAG: NUDIX hydrolase [Holosporaceae bacterium]|jgi:8-oxo-dGTP pyrophosphatase MutT (NUDIX family)|nr:NUDIX hydrolase [Holosporaceae bacterium]
MHRNNLREKLEHYHPTDKREMADKSKMLDFLDSHENCFERSLSIGHFTGSCWIINHDGAKFLLTLHKKMGFWLQLGGHADGDSDIARVSLKEAHEESGLRHIELLSEEIFDIGVHLTPEYQGIPAHYHYDVRFLMRASDPQEHIKISDESDDLRWFDEVSVLPPDSGLNIPRMFKKWKNCRNGGAHEKQ